MCVKAEGVLGDFWVGFLRSGVGRGVWVLVQIWGVKCGCLGGCEVAGLLGRSSGILEEEEGNWILL